MARARLSTGPLLRLLGLAVVLFAVALMHGATPESASGHLVTSAITPPAASSERLLDHVHGSPVSPEPPVASAAEGFVGPREGHGDHTPSHPGDQCAAAQPYPGPSLAQPRFAVSVSEAVAPACGPTVRETGDSWRPDRSSAALRALVVQRI
ncbi:hypothetical protein STRIP9103_00279 [Streptomyces ipomoeae 91-03]|uniref:Uncharacterized protein n=1 Tax=Streptomyces ipomoeae 91-03 TaxID=698759 RepID=L1KPY8_9ACTN|nr:hypothetical protein STRIP9103_00279 [Streptomyces ipomoeae 91-03]